MEITTRPRRRRLRRLASGLTLLALLLVLLLLLPASVGLSQHVVRDSATGAALARGTLTFQRPVHSADEMHVGDVITFPRPGDPAGTLVTRRVVAVDGSRAVTWGDPRAETDAWVVRHGVGRSEPSVTVLAIPYAGYPQVLLPWLTWPLIGVLVALAALASLVAARREARRDRDASARSPAPPRALAT